MNRVEEAKAHIAASGVPPAPYRETFRIGDRCTLRVMFEDTSKLDGTIIDAVATVSGVSLVIMVTVLFDDGQKIVTRGEWLER